MVGGTITRLGFSSALGRSIFIFEAVIDFRIAIMRFVRGAEAFVTNSVEIDHRIDWAVTEHGLAMPLHQLWLAGVRWGVNPEVAVR